LPLYGVQEAKQAAELMALWAPIDTADALELLSPAFHNPEARAISPAKACFSPAGMAFATARVEKTLRREAATGSTRGRMASA